MKKDDNKSTSSQKNAGENILERDQPGPVSVAPEGKDKPSYTHNTDKMKS